MKIKTSKGLKVVIIAVALLLCLALAIGITGAFYQAKRQATGTLSMDQGIIIDYKGFDKTAAEDWATWTRGVTLPLFKTNDSQPGQNIPVNAAGIRANEKSVNFYARVKLSYKFYNVSGETETEVTLANTNDLITTSGNFFGTNWVESGDGYYYYATGSTLNKFAKTATTFVELFATDAKFIIEGAGFTGANNNGEGGGFVDGTTSINKIEVYLTLETLQGDATAEQAKALGWEITTGGTEGENVVELTPEDYTSTTTTDDETGEEKTIYTPSETFVGKNPKYAFTFSLNDTDKTATITGPVGEPTELDIPSKIIVKGQGYTTTSIGKNAFYWCDSLKSVRIGSGVTSIGRQAFCGCTSLTSVIIPNSVTSIVEWAFVYCNLTSITIPDSVTSIGDYTFQNCSGLTSVTIGSGVESIGAGAFRYCSSLTSITIPDSVATLGKETFSGCEGLKSVTIGSGVTSMGYAAFGNCSGLTSVTIGSGVTSIGESAFKGCSSLTSITIPDSVTSIESRAFQDCSSLESITIPDGVATLGNETFSGCEGLKSVTIGSGVTSIGYYTFQNCSGLTSVTIGSGVTSIGEKAFVNCSSLTSIVIPNGVTSIGSGAFSGCSGLISITIPDSVTSIGGSAFVNCSSLTSILIPNGVTIIQEGTFSGCSGLEEIKVADGNENFHSAGNCLIKTASKTLILGCKTSIIPTDGSVTRIEGHAFRDCSSLISITIPNSVTSIGEYAFQGSGLTSITILDSVTSLGDRALENCRDLRSITIGNGVTKITYLAFQFCSGLRSITIGSGVTSISVYAFDFCSGLEEIKVAEGNANYHSAGNCLIETASKTLILGCKTSIIPTDGSVTSIGNMAFSDCESLTSITIPNSVTSIGHWAFKKCSSLTSITISDSVTSIGNNAFNGCTGLTATLGNIGGNWVKESDNTAVPADTLLRNIDYAIKRA